MGASISAPVFKGQLTCELLGLLERQGTNINVETAQEIVKTVLEFSPWFLHAGSFNITDWEQVKADLQNALKERGPEVFPLAILSLRRLIRDALLSNDVIVKEQLVFLNKTLEEIWKAESVNSIRSFEEQDIRSVGNIEEEEEILEKEIALLNKQLGKRGR